MNWLAGHTRRGGFTCVPACPLWCIKVSDFDIAEPYSVYTVEARGGMRLIIKVVIYYETVLLYVVHREQWLWGVWMQGTGGQPQVTWWRVGSRDQVSHILRCWRGSLSPGKHFMNAPWTGCVLPDGWCLELKTQWEKPGSWYECHVK